MDRRTFLRGAGSLIVLLAGGGVWRAWDQGVFRVAQGPAYEPWHDWRGDHGEGPLQLVRDTRNGAPRPVPVVRWRKSSSVEVEV